MSKKILIFSTAYLPFIGGAEIAVKEITDRAETIQFDMITARLNRKLPKREKIGKVDVHRVGIGWPLFDKYFLAFYGHKLAEKLNKERKYDLIWAIMASYGGFAAMFFKRKNRAMPFLLTLQEGDDPEYIKRRVGVFKNLFKEIFRRTNYIQAISNFLSRWAGEQGATCPIEVVPNGVTVEKFRLPVGENNFKLKNELNLEDSDKIIITVSRLVKKNGVDDIIKSLAYLPSNIKLLIAGNGPDRKMLLELARELKLYERIIFLGQVTQVDLPNYLAIADIFVRPSLSEGQGISFLEAMASGVPIVATPVGGIIDFLIDGETGLFCKVRNPESIAEKIKIYLKNKELTDKIKINARELVIKNYDWDLIAKRMEKIFEKVIV